MNTRTIAAILLIGTLFLQCRSAAAPQGTVKFVVGTCEGPMLESVRIMVVRKSGEEVDLGYTAASGVLKVPMRDLAGARFVLFHIDSYFDGAMRIEHISEGTTRYIMLAPFAVL